MKLDKFDIKIIEFLQKNSDVTKAKLASHIGLSVSPCWERVKRLEKNGVIEGYSAKINYDAVAKKSTYFVHVILRSHKRSDWKKFEEAIVEVPEIVECYSMGGSIDYVLKLDVKDVDSYQGVYESLLEMNIGIEKYNAHVATRCVKKESNSNLLK